MISKINKIFIKTTILTASRIDRKLSFHDNTVEVGSNFNIRTPKPANPYLTLPNKILVKIFGNPKSLPIFGQIIVNGQLCPKMRLLHSEKQLSNYA